jgi:SpoIID/LytB domain protein
VSLLAAAVVAALLPGPADASRAVSESYTVPKSGILQLTGHGFGHGHGMSQYGAQGAAKKGLTASKILAFYYPGTDAGTSTGKIRVLITADTDNDVRVLPVTGLKVRDVSSGRKYLLPAPDGIKTWRLRTVNGATVLDYDDGAWHVYRGNGTSAITGDAEFLSSSTVTLRVAGTNRSYRGALRLSNQDTVNKVDLEGYVQGVVPREMPASWEKRALQAQAVAARTYAAFDRAAHETRHYQTCDTTSCQVYGGVGSEDPRSNVAVTSTAEHVRLYAGKPAFTQFASSSGGWLAAGSMPYLVAKADPYDDFSGNPMHTWKTTVTRAAIQRAWPSLGTLKGVKVTQRDGHGEWYGRVEKLVLDGSKKNVTVTGTTFRSKFGLRSAWFHFG